MKQENFISRYSRPATRMVLKKRRKRLNEILIPANEFKIKDLKVDSIFQTKYRATHQNLNPTYKGVDSNGIVYYETNSGTHGPVLKWHQKVQLLDLKEAIKLQKADPTMRNIDVVRLAVFGDLKVFCDDLSFKYYGWQYMAWQLDYGLEPETRFPKKRNPHLAGAVCKHLYAVLGSLPFHIPQITHDLVELGVLEKPKRRR